MKVPNLEQLITLYVQQRTRIGRWITNPDVWNQCLDCGRSLTEHQIITIDSPDDVNASEALLVCPDYIENYKRTDTHDKLLHDILLSL